MQNPRKKKKIIPIIITIIVICAAAFAGWYVYTHKTAGDKADAVVKDLESLIPGLGAEEGYSSGAGRDPMGSLIVRGVDIVGCLEIPSIDLRAPVTVKGGTEQGFAAWLGGSPVKGHFSIIGGMDDVFRNLAKAKPGDRVIFTDIDGVRYEYQVTTQYHLKKWDKGDNDLMLCFNSDSQTRFVLGCTKTL